MKAECSADGTTANITWDSINNASNYPLRINYRSNDQASCLDNWLCPNSPDIVEDAITKTSYTSKIIPEKIYDIWVHSVVNGLGSEETKLTDFACALPAVKTNSEVKDDFNGSLDVSRWNVWKYPSGAPTDSQIKNQALNHYIPAGLKDYVAAVADSKTVKGDFDAMVDLKTAGGATSSSTTDLVFHDDSWKNSLGITLSNLGGVYGFSVLDNKQTVTTVKTGLPMPVTVRIIRVGNVAYYYYKSTFGWEKLGTFAGVYGDTGKIALQSSTRSPDYPEVTGTFDNFTAKINTVDPSPTPGATNACGGTCGSNYNCNAGLVCYSGFCRNPQCKENSDCNCVVAQSPTPAPKANTNTTQPTPTPYRAIQYVSPTPVSSAKPTPKTDMRIYNLDLETPIPTPAPQKRSFVEKIVGFFLKLFGIKY